MTKCHLNACPPKSGLRPVPASELDRPPVWVSSPDTGESWRVGGHHAADPYFLIAAVWAGLSLNGQRSGAESIRPCPLFQRFGVWMVRGDFLGEGNDRAVLHGTPRRSRSTLAPPLAKAGHRLSPAAKPVVERVFRQVQAELG